MFLKISDENLDIKFAIQILLPLQFYYRKYSSFSIKYLSLLNFLCYIYMYTLPL